jgi:Yip1 domain
MEAHVEEQKLGIQEKKLSVGDGLVGMLNIFVDPKATARRIPAPLSWLWPVLVLIAVYATVGVLTAPYAISIADAQIAQRGVPPDQAENARRITHIISQVTPIVTPVFVVLFIALFAWLAVMIGSMAGLRAKFRDVFSLMAACGLITALQSIATLIVLRAKGDEITSQDQLTPPFGLDIFLQNVHGVLLALLNFFSIFQIWYLVVLTIGLAALCKTTKGKAFFAISLSWVVPLLIKIVQAMLQPATSG